THPVTEDRVSHVETTINAQKLKTPAGRPAAASELPEAQAVARAIADPPEVVIPRYRRLAEEKPDDAERQFLLGRVYQTVGQLEAARGALEKCRDLGGLGGRVDRPLGSVYEALKEPAKAREALERHLTKHPDDAFAHPQLGKALADGDQGRAGAASARADLTVRAGRRQARMPDGGAATISNCHVIERAHPWEREPRPSLGGFHVRCDPESGPGDRRQLARPLPVCETRVAA